MSASTGGLTFESRYENLTLAGRTRDGAPFALIAGQHGPHYPYLTPQSTWDSVLLLAGGSGYAISARHLPSLRLAVDLAAPASAGLVSYDGEARRADGVSAHVSFDLGVQLTRFDAHHLGRPYDLLHLGVGPGMRWQPFALRGARGAGDRLVVDARTFEPAAWFGELERGTAVNFRARRFAFAYDYLCVAHAAQARLSSYAHVHFVSHALHRDGAFGRLLDAYLIRTASVETTLVGGATAPRPGNGQGVRAPDRADSAGVIVSDVIDLGLARLERQLVRATDASGREAFGLREIFTPR